MESREKRDGISLHKWIWRSYLRIALAPLLLVELGLVVIYIVATVDSHQRNVSTARSLAEQGLLDAATREASSISKQLAGVAQLTQVFAHQTAVILQQPAVFPPDELARNGVSPQGVYYTLRDAPGRGAMFYSNITPIGPAELEKAARVAQLDPLMVSLKDSSPMVIQAYYNTNDSLNRIYPYFDVLSQYPDRMDIPSYNFYYEADRAHNPTRGVVWTDAYLDPAGAGWIVSAIAPVYRQDVLEGVVGLDVTLGAVVEHVLTLQTPWGGYGILVDTQGVALALPPAAEAEWNLPDLRSPVYPDAVTQDTLKPEAFSLFKLPPLADIGQQMEQQAQGLAPVMLGTPQLAAWASVPETGWRLLILVPQASVLAPADLLRAHGLRIAGLMIGGMVVFYALFFGVMSMRARQQAAQISEPLLGIDRMVRAIGEGQYQHTPALQEVAELNESSALIAAMGARMGEQVQALRDKEVALRHAAAVAEAASRAKSQFLANMSHEIRTPMNGVLGMTELLLASSLSAEQHQYASLVHSSARSLLEIINDILDLSRIDADHFEIQPAPFSLRQVIEELVAVLRPMADQRGISLSLEWDAAASPWVIGDGGRVRQILVNLVGNAVKFTRVGGVWVRVATLPNETLQIAVQDTGIGIPPNRLQAIFDAFTQANGTVTREFGGTGLGLTIASRLIERMGGTIQVQSTVGVGSVFTVGLPLRSTLPPRPPPLTPSAGPSPGPQGLRILVAEDVSVNQILIRALLERDHHQVVMTNDGLEALSHLQTQPVDMAIVDIQMPRMDGLSLVKRIRALEVGTDAHLPVLILSANAMRSDQDVSLDAGADAFLSKPFSQEQLRQILRTLCP